MVGDSNSIYSQLFHLAALARKPQQLLRTHKQGFCHKELALLIRLMSQTLILVPGTGTPLFPPFPPSPLFGVRGPLRAENVLGTSWQW